MRQIMPEDVVPDEMGGTMCPVFKLAQSCIRLPFMVQQGVSITPHSGKSKNACRLRIDLKDNRQQIGQQGNGRSQFKNRLAIQIHNQD